jgi:hypothetical protein
MNKKGNSEQNSESKINIEAKNINSGRDTVLAGGDVETGDSQRNITNQETIVVRGVETDKEELRKLVNALDNLDSAINSSKLKQEDKEAAMHNAQILRNQMSEVSNKKPNDIILSSVAESLYSYGPAITGALVAAFTTPLGGMIATVAGTKALSFYKQLNSTKD